MLIYVIPSICEVYWLFKYCIQRNEQRLTDISSLYLKAFYHLAYLAKYHWIQAALWLVTSLSSCLLHLCKAHVREHTCGYGERRGVAVLQFKGSKHIQISQQPCRFDIISIFIPLRILRLREYLAQRVQQLRRR